MSEKAREMKTKSINDIREQESRILRACCESKRDLSGRYGLVMEIANGYVRNIKRASPDIPKLNLGIGMFGDKPFMDALKQRVHKQHTRKIYAGY